MLKGQLLHPDILAALAGSGHGSKVLISDGNYPHGTKRGPNAKVVYLNLAPGEVLVTDVLKALLTAIPIEKAEVMDPKGDLPADPPIWNEFLQLLHSAGSDLRLDRIGRFDFYDAASTRDVCLTVATGDQRIYANLLLTIGVVKPNP